MLAWLVGWLIRSLLHAISTGGYSIAVWATRELLQPASLAPPSRRLPTHHRLTRLERQMLRCHSAELMATDRLFGVHHTYGHDPCVVLTDVQPLKLPGRSPGLLRHLPPHPRAPRLPHLLRPRVV